MRKVFSYAGNVLGIVGALLLFGSMLVWQIGLKQLSEFYDGNKPLVFAALAGVGLVLLSVVFSVLAGGKELIATSKNATVVGAVPEGIIRCRKCEAINDADAKFCDQCGVDLIG